MKLLPTPIDYGSGDPARDEADAGGYPLRALEVLLTDCDAQPNWRWRADRAHAFYDMGKQLTPYQEAVIRRDWGIEPRQTNLIFGVVNGVLGAEAKARTNVKVEADEDDLTPLCDVFNLRIAEATRESNADMAISGAYASMVKGGIGWVEVSRATDPLEYQYRVEEIHRSEIWWDMRKSRDFGLSKSRWLIRKRWEDLDEAVALMPQFKDILVGCTNGYDLVNLPEDRDTLITIRRAAWNEQRTTIQRDEWVDTGRRRVKFFEVWYRAPAEVVVMQVSPTRRIVFDENNPLHAEAVARGRVRLFKSTTQQVRMALFAGPHRLMDVATTRRRFPYVPFFAFRDDEDGTPYGLIEPMISPQEEYNERRQMWNWMMKARQIIVDSDALDTNFTKIRDLRREAMRPDFMAVLKPDRTHQNALKIGQDIQLQTEQFKAMEDTKALLQEVARVYGPQLGDAPAGVTSGYAINSLVEQGTVAMGEMNDNYRYGRRAVHEEVLALIVEEHLERDLRVMIGSGDRRRVVVLNTFHPETGEPMNMVKDAPMRVGLADVPNSPAYRAQEQEQLAKIIAAVQAIPQAVAVLAPDFIEGSSLPNREHSARALRKMLGVPDPQDRERAEAAAQQAEQAQQQQEQMGQEAMALEFGAKAAAIEKDKSVARLNDAKAAELGAPEPLEPAPQPTEEELAAQEEQALEQELIAAMNGGDRFSVSGLRPGARLH